MKKHANRNFLTGTILAIAAVLFLTLNITSGTLFKSIRLDLTQNKLYTLSTGSKEIIRQLPEPVILRFYFSKKLAKANPYLISFASRVQDLLVQYERSSKGKIILEIIDPEPFSAEEDNAVNYGLRGLPIDNTGTELYLGLVGTDTLNNKKVIPFLQPNREENLEYDISQLIYNLSNPKVKVIGVMSALPINGKSGRPWAIWQQMAQNFELKLIDLNAKEIPENISSLMIVEPKYFNDDALKAIDSFVMRGGHVLAFVDPNSEVADRQIVQQNNLNNLLAAWGVRLEENKVVADRSQAKSIRVMQQGREVTVRYPFWIDFTNKNFDKKDILTATLERITLATPGSLLKLPDAEVTFSPLISTSKEALLVDSQKIPEYQRDLVSFMSKYEPTGTYVVAARISGPVKSAYGAQQNAASNIVIVADADMLHDHFWISVRNIMGQDIAVPSSANGNFIISALDNLSGSDALIGIRNRGTFVRPFETIRALEARSQNRYQLSEQALQQKMDLTKRKLDQLESQKKDGNSMQLSVQQRKEEDAFRNELVETRRELREVRRKLNQDIQVVEAGVKFFSIGFVPLLIVVGCMIAWGAQIQRESKRK